MGVKPFGSALQVVACPTAATGCGWKLVGNSDGRCVLKRAVRLCPIPLMSPCCLTFLMVAASGQVYGCGKNEYGILGAATNVTFPSRALFATADTLSSPHLLSLDLPLLSLSVGLSHVLAVSSNGSVVGWGDATAGALGFSVSPIVSPRALDAFAGIRASAVAAGDYVSFVVGLSCTFAFLDIRLGNGSSVFGIGTNVKGALGLGQEGLGPFLAPVRLQISLEGSVGAFSSRGGVSLLFVGVYPSQLRLTPPEPSPCRPGAFSPSGVEPCAPCAIGQYATAFNSTSCVGCSTGFSTPSVGSASAALCLRTHVVLAPPSQLSIVS